MWRRRAQSARRSRPRTPRGGGSTCTTSAPRGSSCACAMIAGVPIEALAAAGSAASTGRMVRDGPRSATTARARRCTSCASAARSCATCSSCSAACTRRGRQADGLDLKDLQDVLGRFQDRRSGRDAARVGTSSPPTRRSGGADGPRLRRSTRWRPASATRAEHFEGRFAPFAAQAAARAGAQDVPEAAAMKVVATYSIKGGVGKTSAAVNLGTLAARDGLRTLIWDLDPQGAASFLLPHQAEGQGRGQQADPRQGRPAGR